MRIVPEKSYPTSTAGLGPSYSAPSAPGVHDTLRAKLEPGNTTASTAATHAQTLPHTALPAPASTHPLETRLAHWRATQHTLKMDGLRRTFGLAEPVRRGMELDIVRQGEWRPAALGGSAGVSGDILEGRDAEIDWEDVYTGADTREVTSVQTEMEVRLRMNRYAVV